MVQSSAESDRKSAPVTPRAEGGRQAPRTSVQLRQAIAGAEGFAQQSAALTPAVQRSAAPVQRKSVTGGPDLLAVQQKLNALKVPEFDCGTPDGLMGPATRRAVIAFQRSRGLSPDGAIGSQTLGALEAAVSGAPAAAQAQGPAPAGAPSASGGAPAPAAAAAPKDAGDKKDPAKSASESQEAPAPEGGTPKAMVASGAYRGKGKFKAGDKAVFGGFEDGTLQAVLDDLCTNWAKLGDPNVASNPDDVAKGGDSSGKSSGEHPKWVKVFQEKLMGLSKAEWNEDAEAGQKVCEAFLIAWAALKNGGKVPGNVAAFMGEVGASESNKQAQHLGGWTDNPDTARDEGADWCAEASNNAVIIGLMRAGLRFSAVKPWKKGPLLVDIKNQAVHFVSVWARKHGQSNGALDPGDVVSIVGHGPASGHVATVVHKEDPSQKTGKLDIVSGNAGGVRGKEGAVRAEQVVVAEPPADYNYTKAYTNAPGYTGPKKAEREPPGHVYVVSITKASRLDPSALLATVKEGDKSSETLKSYGLEIFDPKATFTEPSQVKDLKNYIGL